MESRGEWHGRERVSGREGEKRSVAKETVKVREEMGQRGSEGVFTFSVGVYDKKGT